MASATRFGENLLIECEREPIHIPGAIQPFGVLLTVDQGNLIVHNASENCEICWGLSAAGLVGRPLSQFLSEVSVNDLKAYLGHPKFSEQSALVVRLKLAAENNLNLWELKAHHHLDTLFLEIEPAKVAPGTENGAQFHHIIRNAVLALQHAKTLQDLADVTAQQIKVITGFDRVMIYRFDNDWHGQVIAEARSTEMESYLGHYFPASDIPAQARAIFLQNWLRMIPDVGYSPSPIYPGRHHPSGAPLDLSKSTLRSVSPVHLEYLKNMGVMASLTVSLIDGEKLWGLIACHHIQPLLVSPDARDAAQMIGQIVSSQLSIKVASDELTYKKHLGEVVAQLLELVESEEEMVRGLTQYSPNLLDLGKSKENAAAVCYGNKWTLLGKTPPIEDLQTIVAWLEANTSNKAVFQTSSLSQHIPQATKYKEIASGLLAIPLTRSANDYILCFRPEVATTVTWAGRPDKVVVQRGNSLLLHPRKSFESWQENVMGTAIPWKQVEIEAAEALRKGIITAALQREYKKEQEARKKAEQLRREKEEMVMIVSHDLRNPLNVISMSFQFLNRFNPIEDPSVHRMVERGARATKAMEKLITNILDVAKLENDELNLVLSAEEPAGLIKETVDFFSQAAGDKGVELLYAAADDAPSCQVYWERDRISQVLNNLLSNAVKFTPPGGKIAVTFQAQEAAVLFGVIDTGPGIPPQNIPKLFDRFWQAEDTSRLGTGLGLWIAKEIVEKHNGKLWVESKLGAGSAFYFTLPKVISV
jgi:chemotaxis family two-component system sensor kinase Cph1